MNNVEDHVHLLFELHRTEALSDIVMHLKTSSSKWLKERSPTYNAFDWQDGFGAFSLGMSQKETVVDYLRRSKRSTALFPFRTSSAAC